MASQCGNDSCGSGKADFSELFGDVFGQCFGKNFDPDKAKEMFNQKQDITVQCSSCKSEKKVAKCSIDAGLIRCNCGGIMIFKRSY